MCKRRTMFLVEACAIALIAAAALLLALGWGIRPAFAGAADVPAAEQDGGFNVCGTCEWRIDNDGELLIRPIRGGEGAIDDSDCSPWLDRPYRIKSVRIEGKVSTHTCCGWFQGCENLVEADLRNLDTSGVDNMYAMFCGCKKLERVNLSGLDTSAVTQMPQMFHSCSSLRSLDLSALDTSSVTDMTAMFYGCTSLESLDLTGFDTSSVEYMSDVFEGCESLRSLDLSSFDTSAAKYVDDLFKGVPIEKITVGKDFDIKAASAFPGTAEDEWVKKGDRHALGKTDIMRQHNHEEATYSIVKPLGALIEDVTLGSDEGIGLTFWARLSELPAGAGDDGCVEFSIGGKRARSLRVALDEGVQRDDGLYGFSFPLSAIELAEPVTATVCCVQGNSEAKTCSAKDCIAALGDGEAGAVDESTLARAKALADMGHYTQPFFSELNKWALGTDYQTMDLFYTRAYRLDDIEHLLQRQKSVIEVEDSGIEKIECSLELGSRATMKLYFTLEKGVKFKGRAVFNGKDNSQVIRPERQDDGRYLVCVTDIAPCDFSRTLEMGMRDDFDRPFTIIMTPNLYLLRLWYKYSDKPVYRNAIASICAYNTACNCEMELVQ